MKIPHIAGIGFIAAIALGFASFPSGAFARGNDLQEELQEKPGAEQLQQAPAPTPAPVAASSFLQSPAWSKLDAPTQAAWQAAMKSDPSQRMDCFVRVDPPADRGDESFLISNGFNVRMFSGPVASGWVAAKDLQGVAELPFVRSVRLSSN